jgi:hypothetical protein
MAKQEPVEIERPPTGEWVVVKFDVVNGRVDPNDYGDECGLPDGGVWNNRGHAIAAMRWWERLQSAPPHHAFRVRRRTV